MSSPEPQTAQSETVHEGEGQKMRLPDLNNDAAFTKLMKIQSFRETVEDMKPIATRQHFRHRIGG
jgi:hypothetical protein